MTRTVSDARHSALPTLEQGRVEVIGGADGGRYASVERGQPAVVGRDEGCDLRLKDPRVSGRHVEIGLAKRGFLVKDLGSRNGTHMGATAVGEIALAPGSEIRIGDTYLLLHLPTPTSLPPVSDRSAMGALVGESTAMRRLYAVLERAARSCAPVLIQGETGSGKELAARAIHDASPRADAPFVVWDRSAESIAGAEGGSLFVDDVDDVPEVVLPMLARLAEAPDRDSPASDVRLLSATSANLADEVAAGRFRKELYYRICVLSVSVPPLRERLDDIPVLVDRLLAEEAGTDFAVGAIDGPNLEQLVQHSWPGNVRELRNVLRAGLASGGATFAELHLDIAPAPTTINAQASFAEQKKQLVRSFEEKFLRDLMQRADGNIRAACRDSGLERTQLKRLLDKYGLRGA